MTQDSDTFDALMAEVARRSAIEPGLAELWIAGWEDAARFVERLAATPDPAGLDVARLRRWTGEHAMRWDKYPAGTTVVDAEELDAYLALRASGSQEDPA